MDVSPFLKLLRTHIEQCDFAGYDPYDALNSTLVRALTFGSKWGRIAWTQLFRRLPVDLRSVFGVPNGHNPKAIGLFLGGYARLQAKQEAGSYQHEPEASATGPVEPSCSPDPVSCTSNNLINHLVELLHGLRSPNYSGNCWGYNFDWQSRAAFVPAGTPTIVNTAFIGHALLDAHELANSRPALDMARRIREFLLNDLHRSAESGPFCFSYTPVDKNYVHNASLLGASLLFRLSKIDNDSKAGETALRALDYSMHCQHDDGAWFYAENPMQHWIDSFHTGFNLEAVRHFLQLGAAEQYREQYERGVEYYSHHFFLPDGTPKYYHDRLYPIDIHCPAEAVSFFAGMGPDYADLTDQILSWMLANLWDERRGCFWHRKGRFVTNRIPYIRWNQAWGFRALTTYAYHQNRMDKKE